MEIEIITYDIKKMKMGSKLVNISAIFFILLLIPHAHINYLIFPSTIFLFLLIIGGILVHQSKKNISQIGKLILDSNLTIADIGDRKFEIVNKNFSVEFSKLGFKGESNYTPLRLNGMLTSHSGINKIKFYNENESVEYNIMIISLRQYNKLEELISNNYMK